MDTEATRSLISIRLQMLLAVFGKKTNDETLNALKRIFCEALESFPTHAISKGFSKAEQSLERFPTPKLMRELCAEFLPPEIWRYDYKQAVDHEGIPCLIDPDPDCRVCRRRKSEHPTESCRATQYHEDRYMYLPQDCPEGRAFLALLAKIAGR